MEDIIINSILCFINSAKNDYSKETLKGVAYSFYSHEIIKEAKIILCNLLKKDIVWRRDPDKKGKDLADVLDFHEDLVSERNNYKFLCNNYKGMPPLGMEMIAPLLINLSTEVTKINEVLPKIVDIKTEVLNASDTVRQLKVDFSDFKGKFSSAINGIQAAAEDVATEDLEIMKEISSFRQSLGGGRNMAPVTTNKPIDEDSLDDGEPSGACGVRNDVNEDERNDSISIASERATGVIPKIRDELYSEKLKKIRKETESHGPGAVLKSNVHTQSYSKTKIVVNPNIGRSPSGQDRVSSHSRQFQGSKRLRGSGKSSVANGTSVFKAVRRTVDVFLGRVDKEASSDIIREYIRDNFNITCHNVERLDIKADWCNAFKITVSLSDRDSLFNTDLWPEDIIISKFYNKNKNRINPVRGDTN